MENLKNKFVDSLKNKGKAYLKSKPWGLAASTLFGNKKEQKPQFRILMLVAKDNNNFY